MNLNHEAVKQEMQAQRWNVTSLAAHLGIDRSTLSSYLTGRRRVTGDIYKGLVLTLKVHPAVFLGPEDYKTAIVQMAGAFGLAVADLDQLGDPRFPELDNDLSRVSV